MGDQLNIDSLISFKDFLKNNLQYKQPSAITSQNYVNHFKTPINLIQNHISAGNFTKIYPFLTEPIYFDFWDDTLFEYVGNLGTGLTIILDELIEIFGQKPSYLNIVDESNLSVNNYSDLKVTMEFVKIYIDRIIGDNELNLHSSFL